MLSCGEQPKKNSSEWINLFDGTSLKGWRAYNGDQMPPGWKIVDSVLTFTTDQIIEKDYDYKGSRDIIYGATEFDNFELYVEWKIPRGGNSGIFYHLKEGYDGPPVVAPEYQLLDDENYEEVHNYKLNLLLNEISFLIQIQCTFSFNLLFHVAVGNWFDDVLPARLVKTNGRP